MNYAVCALIIKDQKVLAVSRKDNPQDLGLIGGKANPNESLRQALHREVEEETGLSFEDKDCRLIFSSMCGDYMSLTYYIKSYSGSIHTNESGIVKFVDYDEIISDNCSFKEYNMDLLDTIFNCFND